MRTSIHRLFLFLSLGAVVATGCGPDVAAVGAGATSAGVSPPNYTMDFDSILMKVDANEIVQPDSQGSVLLLEPASNAQPGEEYKIFDNTDRCCRLASPGEIDTLYNSGIAVTTAAIPVGGGDVNILWSDFDLLGKILNQSRTLLVKRTSAGVASYEKFSVLFRGPSL